MAYELATGMETELGPSGLKVSTRMAPTSDGQRLIFTHNLPMDDAALIPNRSCIKWLGLDGGGTVNIACEDEVYLSSPLLSSNETEIIVTMAGFEFAQLQMYQLLPGASGHTIGCCAQPAMFPDYLSLAVVANDFFLPAQFDEQTHWGIFRINTGGGGSINPLLKSPDIVSEPDISPDGRRILYTRRTQELPSQVEVLDLFSGETRTLFPGSSPVWGPAVSVQPMDADLLARKGTLIGALSQTTYAGRYGVESDPLPAYNEDASADLVAEFVQAPDAVSPAQADAFARLMLQEEALYSTLQSYKVLRDDHADTVVDMISMGVGSVFLLLPYNDNSVAEALASEVTGLFEDTLLFVLGTIADPALREATQTAVTATYDLLEASTLTPDYFAELLISAPLRERVASQLTTELVRPVQPTLDQGVRSVVGVGDPRWEVSGTSNLAGTQTALVASISQLESERAHGQYEDIVQGAALNELLTDMGDLGMQAGVPFAEVVSATGRAINLLLNLGSQWLLGDAMSCIRNLSTLAGEMAFQPPTDLLGGCDDPRINGVSDEALTAATGIDFSIWQQQTAPALTTAMDEFLAVTAAEPLSLPALFAAQTAVHAAAHEGLLALLPADGRSWTPETAVLAQQLLAFQAQGINLLLTATALEETPQDAALQTQQQELLDRLETQRQAISSAMDALPLTSGTAVPLMLFAELPRQLVGTPGSATTFELSVRNAGSATAEETHLLSQVRDQEVQAFGIPATAPGNSTRVAIAIPPLPAGSYVVALTLRESGEADIQLVSLLVTNEPVSEGTAVISEQPAISDTGTSSPESQAANSDEEGSRSHSTWVIYLFVVLGVSLLAAILWILRHRQPS